MVSHQRYFTGDLLLGGKRVSVGAYSAKSAAAAIEGIGLPAECAIVAAVPGPAGSRHAA